MLDVWKRERRGLGKQAPSKALFLLLIYFDWTSPDKEVIIKFLVQGQIENRKNLRVYLKLQSLFL